MTTSTYSRITGRYSSWLQVTVGTTLGLSVAAIWGFAEATFWFIAPDFILILFCAFVPASWKKMVVAALAGSLLGGLVSFLLNSFYPEQMGQILRATPFVTARMIDEIDALYTLHSHLAVFYQSFSFMQFKIWTHLAVLHDFNPVLYFLIVMVSRTIRLAGVAFVAQFVGRRIPGFLNRHAILLTVLHAVFFLLMLIRVEGQ